MIRIYSYIAAALAIICLGWFGHHSIWKDGYDTANSENMVKQQAAALEAHEHNAALLEKLEVTKNDNLETIAALNRKLTSRVRLPSAICADCQAKTPGGVQEAPGTGRAAEATGRSFERAQQGLDRYDDAIRADYLRYSEVIEDCRTVQDWAREQ